MPGTAEINGDPVTAPDTSGQVSTPQDSCHLVPISPECRKGRRWVWAAGDSSAPSAKVAYRLTCCVTLGRSHPSPGFTFPSGI